MIVLALVVFLAIEVQLLMVLDYLEKIKEFIRRMCIKHDKEKEFNDEDDRRMHYDS